MQGNCAPAPLVSDLTDLPIKPAKALAVWFAAAAALWALIGGLSLGVIHLF